MSHITLAQQGLAAVDSKKYDEAIPKLSAALKVSPNPAWLIARSKALISKSRFEEALRDAEMAWHTAYDRNKRPLMVEAHYRRAVAYYRLKQYANADACCVYAMKMIKGEKVTTEDNPAAGFVDGRGFWTATLEDAKQEAASDPMNKSGMGMAMQQKPHEQTQEWRAASTLRMQILVTMQKLDPEAHGRKFSTSYKPEKRSLLNVDGESDTTEQGGKSSDPVTKPGSTSAAAGATGQPVAKPAVPADAPLRLQDFQTGSYISVSILSKGNSKESVNVEFSSSSAHLKNVVFPNGDKRDHVINLWGQIKPEVSTYTVTPNKIELKLIKATAGNWKLLQADPAIKTAESHPTAAPTPSQQPSTATAPAGTTQDNPQKPTPSSAPEARPAYRTSSRQGPTNWDKVANDEDDGQDDGGDVNGFFKKLFKNATPEQQRAMVKSFTESNGTSLSTDWGDVGNRTVESVPPEGMEAKRYDS